MSGGLEVVGAFRDQPSAEQRESLLVKSESRK
jgi:hypothetical protein